MGVLGSSRMVPASTGGGTGAGVQTGIGSPLNVVIPAYAGAPYTDQATGNIWVAETTSSASWVMSPNPAITFPLYFAQNT